MPSHSWALLCAVHGVASLLLWWAGAGTQEALTWRAHGWLQQPWTLWSSAWVHVNTAHLMGNLLALGALAAFAWVVRPSLLCTLAWLLAWPLAQLSLLLWPQVVFAVGLSGLLHAGAAVLAVQLLLRRMPVARSGMWGCLLALGLVAKLVLEGGWNTPVAWDAGNGMPVVRAAHLGGAFWGLALAVCLNPWALRRPRLAAPPKSGV